MHSAEGMTKMLKEQRWSAHQIMIIILILLVIGRPAREPSLQDKETPHGVPTSLPARRVAVRRCVI